MRPSMRPFMGKGAFVVGFRADPFRIPHLLVFTVFQRVIAFFPILTILGYGSARAFDVHEGHEGDHEHALEYEGPGSDVDAAS